jgi:hypothetical protein
MVRKAFQITAPQTASVKMEIPGVLDCLADSDSKLGIKVLSELMRNFIVLAQNLVQVSLDPPMELNLHGGAAQRPVRRR